MTDQPTTPSGKVPGRGAYKGLYRSDPPALTEQSGDVLPPISIGLSDLLGGIDGTDHGRRRVYNLSDEPLAPYQRPCAVVLGPVPVDDDAHADDAETDARVDDDQADAVADDARADVLTADYDDAEGLEL